MRISYKTHPALRFFLKHEKEVVSIDRPKWETDYLAILESALLSIREYKGKINLASDSFIDAAGVAQHKLGPLAEDILKDPAQELHIEGIYMMGRLITYVKLDKSLGETISIESISLDKSGALVAYQKGDYFYTSLYIEIEEKTRRNAIIQAMKFSSACVILELFKNYASVELKEVCRQKKERVPGQKEPIFNELDRAILHLNSFWFTELVRSEAFSVSGHLRLQPYKNEAGEWDKKLIWINTFMKTGYHRRPQKQIELESLSPE